MRDDCYYLEDGFWALVENGKVRIGITDYLQRTLGDAAFVELPKKGLETERGGEIGALETAKASIPIISPVSGAIEEVNGALDERPELVNSDPYGEGWFAVITPRNLGEELKKLMSAEDYFELMLKKLETDHKRGGTE